MTTFAHAARRLLSQPLALDQRFAARLIRDARTAESPEDRSGSQPMSFFLDDLVRSGPAVPVTRRGSLAVVRVSGVMMHEADVVDRLFMGSIEYGEIADAIDEAAADESVAAVVLDMHTPGGTCHGQSDALSAIERCRASKPVYTVAHELVASAGMYLASACDDVIATPTSELGSVGTMIMLLDDSEWFAKMGDRAVPVTTGRFKTVGAAGVPISDEDVAHVLGRITPHFEDFAEAVAAFSGRSVDEVKAMEAAVYFASEAAGHGLCRVVSDYETALDEIERAVGSPAASAARTPGPGRKEPAMSTDRRRLPNSKNQNKKNETPDQEGMPDYESMDPELLEQHMARIKAAMGEEEPETPEAEGGQTTPEDPDKQDPEAAGVLPNEPEVKPEDPGDKAGNSQTRPASRDELTQLVANEDGGLSAEAKAFIFDAEAKKMNPMAAANEWVRTQRKVSRLDQSTVDPVASGSGGGGGGSFSSYSQAVAEARKRPEIHSHAEAVAFVNRTYPELRAKLAGA